VKDELAHDYKSQIVDWVRTQGSLVVGDLTLRLAKEFGFCYGVERAVDYAYETRKRFPDRSIYLTTELIHNPRVNSVLRKMGIGFLNGEGPSDRKIEDLTPDDVVIISAFGTLMEEIDLLKGKGCVLVDATCGSVVLVWKRVEQYARDGFTAVVHGNFQHEETRATVSRATHYPGGKYVVVWDKAEANQVCDYIRTGKSRASFMAGFSSKASPGFDPDRDLQRVGVANQTTMLSSESLQIGEMLKEAMRERYGQSHLAEHFRSFDTICTATQDRQDAILELVKDPADLFIVIGGFNSSNTGHLCEIASQHAPAYHIEEADCIRSSEEICHKPVGQKEVVLSRGWLPKGPTAVAVTAGASTPNRVIGEAIERIVQVKGYSLDGLSI